MKAKTQAATRLTLCASERLKCIGSVDGFFPDIGHHEEQEMGGVWLHPIKLLDGFWLRLHDRAAANVNTWIHADGFEITPEGNRFLYGNGLGHTPVVITRDQLAPEGLGGLVVTYRLTNTGPESRPLALEFLAQTDLRPVWFSETIGLVDGNRDTGTWLPEEDVFLSKDQDHEWYVAVGASQTPTQVQGDRQGPQNTHNNGVAFSLVFDLELSPGEEKTLSFFIAGSYTSRSECLADYRRLATGTDFQGEKARRYQTLLSRSLLTLADAPFVEVYNWIKVNTDWLIQDSGTHGRGLTAGLPEYPWWFGCDNAYALQGVLALGDFELCRDTLQLLLDSSRKANGNGRIVHEVTTGGVCAHPGNTQETGHFLFTLYEYYQWTGDRDFLERAFPYLQKSVEWLEAQDTDGDLFPSGYGIIEIAGLNSEMIDSAVYTCAGYHSFAQICRVLGQETLALAWEEKSKALKQAINTQFWDAEAGLYCDTFTSVAVVKANLEAILGRVPAALKADTASLMEALLAGKTLLGEQESGWLINQNWVINTPMEMGLAPPEKAEQALAKLHTDRFIGPYGMYLNGLYRDTTMTISTGVMAVAQARYGHADRALELLKRMFQTFGMATPGCVSEMSPDYGCFVQAWTAYGAFVPVVQYFFGVRPQFHEHRVLLAPSMPRDWPEAKLSDVRVPGGTLTLSYRREGDSQHLRVEGNSTLPLWFQGQPRSTWVVNGERLTSQEKEFLVPVGLG